MNERTIGRRIIDQTDPWEIIQQSRDATDVLRIAMGEHQSRESILPFGETPVFPRKWTSENIVGNRWMFGL